MSIPVILLRRGWNASGQNDDETEGKKRYLRRDAPRCKSTVQNNKNVPSFLGSWAKFLAIDSIAEVA